MTGIHTNTDLRGARDRARRGVGYAVGCGGPPTVPQPRKRRMRVSPGEAKGRDRRRSHTREPVGSPPPGCDTHGGSTTKQGIGEEAGESYGKTSFLPVL